MALCKRGNIWWIRLRFQGRQIQRSTRTVNKRKAQELHDKFKAELWDNYYLNKAPEKLWIEAVERWIHESQHKKSLIDDLCHLKWLDKYLRTKQLNELTREYIEYIAKEKEKTGVKPASVNLMLALVRAILRKAKNEWGWIEAVPTIRMRKVENKRVRWLTREEADRLISELPHHLKMMAIFTLATGLRASNVMNLKWKQIDIDKKHAFISSSESKTKKAIPIPLNEDAINILKCQKQNSEYVFTYRNKPVTQCSTRAWRKALRRAEIENFRWHDLRHTWASWHVQNGTTLQELQVLGGWTSFDMVLRYAHLSSDHLQQAANRISGAKWVQSNNFDNQKIT